MQFTGEYILRKALLQNQNMKTLKTQEMQKVLVDSWNTHIGLAKEGKLLTRLYGKPELKEVTVEEVNSHLMNFLRDIREGNSVREVLDVLDKIQLDIEKLCPFGSMLKIFHKNWEKTDEWFVPNKEYSTLGIVSINGLMEYFEEATFGENPIVINDIFTLDYQKENLSFLKVNGKLRGKWDTLTDIWYETIWALSEATRSNFHKLPVEDYEWNLFWFPLKGTEHKTLAKSNFDKKYKGQKEILELSISSLDSLENDKLVKVWMSI
jgi:hypothetical protein